MQPFEKDEPRDGCSNHSMIFVSGRKRNFKWTNTYISLKANTTKIISFFARLIWRVQIIHAGRAITMTSVRMSAAAMMSQKGI
jgi:hypothetical protein